MPRPSTIHQKSLQWRHNERDGVSNHQPHDDLLYRLFRRRSKKTSKLRVIGLCAGNSSVTGEFPAQRASHTENVFHLMTSSYIHLFCLVSWYFILLNETFLSKYKPFRCETKLTYRLLMRWFLGSPSLQGPWYWLFKVNSSLPFTGTGTIF